MALSAAIVGAIAKELLRALPTILWGSRSCDVPGTTNAADPQPVLSRTRWRVHDGDGACDLAVPSRRQCPVDRPRQAGDPEVRWWSLHLRPGRWAPIGPHPPCRRGVSCAAGAARQRGRHGAIMEGRRRPKCRSWILPTSGSRSAALVSPPWGARPPPQLGCWRSLSGWFRSWAPIRLMARTVESRRLSRVGRLHWPRSMMAEHGCGGRSGTVPAGREETDSGRNGCRPDAGMRANDGLGLPRSVSRPVPAKRARGR